MLVKPIPWKSFRPPFFIGWLMSFTICYKGLSSSNPGSCHQFCLKMVATSFPSRVLLAKNQKEIQGLMNGNILAPSFLFSASHEGLISWRVLTALPSPKLT